MRRYANPDDKFSRHTQEQAFGALENVNHQIAAFLAAVRPSLADAMDVRGDKDVDGELAYLRETVTEHLRSQLPEAFEAAAEWTDADPMVSQVAQQVAA